jgi:hypothetical protein
MLLWTVLGIRNNWYGRHSFNNDTINLLKPDHHHESLLDDLTNFFFRPPHIMYTILFTSSTISVYRYVWVSKIHIQFFMFHNSHLPNKMTDPLVHYDLWLYHAGIHADIILYNFSKLPQNCMDDMKICRLEIMNITYY